MCLQLVPADLPPEEQVRHVHDHGWGAWGILGRKEVKLERILFWTSDGLWVEPAPRKYKLNELLYHIAAIRRLLQQPVISKAQGNCIPVSNGKQLHTSYLRSVPQKYPPSWSRTSIANETMWVFGEAILQWRPYTKYPSALLRKCPRFTGHQSDRIWCSWQKSSMFSPKRA